MANDNNNQRMPQQGGRPAPGAQQGRAAAGAGQQPRRYAAKGQPGARPTGRPIASAAQGGQADKGVNGAGAGSAGRSGQGGVGKLNISKRTVLIIAGIVVAALAIWLLVFLFACNGSSLIDPGARDGQAPYKSEEEMQAELDRQVEEGMFNISIASVIQFEDGTSNGTAYIENVPGNHYLMQVTITEDDTGDVLYESGVLKPNQYIENIALAKDLDAGTYEATATFKAMDETSYDEVGQAAAKVTINVLN